MGDIGTGIGVPVLRATQGVERTGARNFPHRFRIVRTGTRNGRQTLTLILNFDPPTVENPKKMSSVPHMPLAYTRDERGWTLSDVRRRETDGTRFRAPPGGE